VCQKHNINVREDKRGKARAERQGASGLNISRVRVHKLRSINREILRIVTLRRKKRKSQTRGFKKEKGKGRKEGRAGDWTEEKRRRKREGNEEQNRVRKRECL